MQKTAGIVNSRLQYVLSFHFVPCRAGPLAGRGNGRLVYLPGGV